MSAVAGWIVATVCRRVEAIIRGMRMFAGGKLVSGARSK